jgi:CubicO group peptidase (beta-lactamase class C family)
MKAKLLFLLLAVILSACATQSTPDPKVLSAEFDALVEKNHQAGLFDGSVLVTQNGQVIFSKGYGFADRERKIPNTPQTKFHLASIGKQFTAMAILLLQEQGKLSVEDGICNYITNCPEIFKPVKIRHLLSQSAGLPNSTAYSMPGDQMLSKNATLFFKPGEQFKYQDVTFNIAGSIIETVSGQSYASFLKQNIFEPLGMSNTGVDDMKQTDLDLAKGYSNAEGDIALQPVYGLFAAGSVYSTVEDMYRWDQALYGDKLLPQSSLKAMFTPQVAVPDGEYYGSIDGSKGWSYGYGWFIAPEELGYVLHGGTLPGYRTEIRRYIDDKTVIILLTNHEAVALYPTAEAIAGKLLGSRK